ncbi:MULTISPECIES: NAD/NADP octopine/nopaline dehydrogenase family protein [unclassified Mesorhizobium]|uniref:NAD/NADP octopine/nopaline dehydrogenase family protein n=1 Tax=unclassified Mesorhizobium TaxID=325217 RepID=UPI000FD332A1|nr:MULTISPECIES: NAD/NADP octopine/nopaline dehydrogenase family protein [unclassified Mesorhizobium]RUV87567.1 NAD/NADP octopine/nopaline dehydrogenase [Mesorhizobium sp. M5C.F.Ca.IN.020.14.1.1]RUV28760.1 NAD/NADP octopine/nopaline dehydrogenase [Mesorhizobium sp. M5C.F.Ca.IN.020.32.2.1]RWG50752.1 MAG: NAD/NADP octopine/nopaline dehydrogenase [Mesorhizobium sp.]RWH55724.1 MAG: NAD/NADP octopine/nopaline dehydrogenase [Mesorhizobium sp.]RWI67761.1 MAG: NAD/NADP octopine/nopaline dehydrogenase 
MQVGIVGAGNIGMGYAAFLLLNGHDASVWSPSGKRSEALRNGEAMIVTGAVEGSFSPRTCTSAEELAKADVIVLALPAYGHRRVLDALIPFVEQRHTIIISGHLSFAALYLSKKLAERGVDIPIVAWSTTVLTGKPRGANHINVGALRSTVDMATLPARHAARALDICVGLFGDRFAPKDDILTIALSNINPQAHLAEALCNLTRIERNESWLQNTMVTSTVGKCIEALDKERLAVANALGKSVRTIFDHYRLSYGITGESVTEICAKQVGRGSDPVGPTGLDTRWITEDVPYGIVPTIYLAKLAGVAMPLHQSSLNIISACYGRDFAADNDLLTEINPLEVGSMTTLMANGYAGVTR